MTDIDRTALRAAEDQRCRALLERDEATLAAMLAEDLVHIHLNGATDDKPGYLRGFREAYVFHAISRGDLVIRVFGDTAVMTGPLRQRLEVRQTGQILDVAAVTTQVWSRVGSGWRLNTCHNAPLPRADG